MIKRIMKPVAVVICNYNKKDFVLDCIASVFASDFKDFDLIVVDNASTDGSAEAVRERWGDRLTLLVNEENTGGSGGFCRGMTYAMDKGCYKYIHLLDDDVVLDKGAIGALYGFMETHPEAGVCGSLVCRMAVRDYIQDYGAMIDKERIGVTPLYGGRRVDEGLPDSVECDYVAACSAVFRTDVLKITGVMDEKFFIYWDDMALCWEIRLAGYKVCAHAKSVVWHEGRYADRTAFSRYYSIRNKIHCFAKYLSDDEFHAFIGILTNMIFRIFIVNLNNPGHIKNYFFALDDALNGVRGKAETYKIVNADNISEKYRRVFAGKRRILLLYDKAVPEIDRVVQKIKKVSEAEICLYAGGDDAPSVAGITHAASPDVDCDLTVQLCYHILDVGTYDRTKVYIDKYTNAILDDADFDFYENYESHRAFFNAVFAGFIKEKLHALREKLRNA
ncbi:MAG: glycosyltransferase family 2 protein, partial [Clostridiales Family XIII bacterium]|nr:glycosyltransferase family 2 protein [Clostridiales Family XIII bacterium]